MKINRKWLAAALVVAAIAVPLIVKTLRGSVGVEVEISSAALKEVRPTILASGILAYQNEINLTSEVLGKVAAIEVKEGDAVQAGQLLLRLDPKLYDNAIAREEASLRQSRIDIERQRSTLTLREKQFQRTQALVTQQLIDRNSFDENRNQLALARADLLTSEEALRRADATQSDAREQRGKTEIHAPISGRVVELPIKVGETAVPSTQSFAGAKLMKIADTSVIQAELKVDEADIGKVNVGQSAEVYPAAYPDVPLKGIIDQIALSPTIENQGREYKVTVRLAAPGNLKLRSGMSARADILLGDSRRLLVVPVEAVISEEGDAGKTTHYIWLADNGVSKKVAVELGLSDDRWQAITKGVTLGDSVIIGPGKTLHALHDGVRVKPQKNKPVNEEEDSNSKGKGE